MNVTPLEKPTARPPIQMKRPKKRAQRNEVTPGAIEGERRCIARNPRRRRSEKKFTEPVALSSTSPGEPSASAYGPRELLRPTRAPCSVQEETYWPGQALRKHVRNEIDAFCAQGIVHISTVFAGGWG